MSSSSDILVIGAGVLGLSTASVLAARGASVTVIDPGGTNASAVAAGMIAPAMEALSDFRTIGRDNSDLFRAAAALWPGFAASRSLPLHDEGARWCGSDSPSVQSALTRLGFEAWLDGEAVQVAGERRVEPAAALAALAASPGVVCRIGQAVDLARKASDWTVTLLDGTRLQAPAVVVATGAVTTMAAPPSLAAILARVSPIKGQIAHLVHPPVGQVVRGDSGYVAPAPGGVVFGATMQPGLSDLTPDPVAGAALASACMTMIGETEPGELVWRVGLRGTSPDGLPMAGIIENGLYVALAPRRNGWLMGPLVAEIVAGAVAGQPAGAWAAPLDPVRFDRTARDMNQGSSLPT